MTIGGFIFRVFLCPPVGARFLCYRDRGCRFSLTFRSTRSRLLATLSCRDHVLRGRCR